MEWNKMLKNDIAKRYAEVKYIWWNIADNKQHPENTKADLYRIGLTMNKKDLINETKSYMNRIANAKKVLFEMEFTVI